MKNIKKINSSNTIRCAHCGEFNVKLLVDGYNIAQFRCIECEKYFAKEYK